MFDGWMNGRTANGPWTIPTHLANVYLVLELARSRPRGREDGAPVAVLGSIGEGDGVVQRGHLEEKKWGKGHNNRRVRGGGGAGG